MPPLSPHLFWDTDPSRMDWEKHAAWLTRRVLEYGDWSDWQALLAHYGKDRLREIITTLRSLQPKARAFCQVWFGLTEDSFRCSTRPQSL